MIYEPSAASPYAAPHLPAPRAWRKPPHDPFISPHAPGRFSAQQRGARVDSVRPTYARLRQGLETSRSRVALGAARDDRTSVRGVRRAERREGWAASGGRGGVAFPRVPIALAHC